MTLLGLAGAFRLFWIIAACLLLAAFLLACNRSDADSATSDRLLLLEAEAHSLEESLETLHEENEAVLREMAALRDENAALSSELATLEQAQAEFIQQQAAAQAAREHEEEIAGFEQGQAQQLADLEAGQDRTEPLLDSLDDRLQRLEEFISNADLDLSGKEDWNKPTNNSSQPDSNALEKTTQMAEEAGGEVYRIDSGQPEERAILVMPAEPIDGSPLIVSLHGYGSNTAGHSESFPLHRQVVSRGFGLLLPNGTPDGKGNQSWNSTDQVSTTGKASADDYAYLAGLVTRAKEFKDFGAVYVFGYSNGGFMAYHLACKGLPGLRAVASIAGTSYVDDASCEDAPPVSVLHIHGSADEVILYGGEVAEPLLEADGEPASYAMQCPGHGDALGTTRRLRMAEDLSGIRLLRGAGP